MLHLVLITLCVSTFQGVNSECHCMYDQNCACPKSFVCMATGSCAPCEAVPCTSYSAKCPCPAASVCSTVDASCHPCSTTLCTAFNPADMVSFPLVTPTANQRASVISTLSSPRVGEGVRLPLMVYDDNTRLWKGWIPNRADVGTVLMEDNKLTFILIGKGYAYATGQVDPLSVRAWINISMSLDDLVVSTNDLITLWELRDKYQGRALSVNMYRRSATRWAVGLTFESGRGWERGPLLHTPYVDLPTNLSRGRHVWTVSWERGDYMCLSIDSQVLIYYNTTLMLRAPTELTLGIQATMDRITGTLIMTDLSVWADRKTYVPLGPGSCSAEFDEIIATTDNIQEWVFQETNKGKNIKADSITKTLNITVAKGEYAFVETKIVGKYSVGYFVALSLDLDSTVVTEGQGFTLLEITDEYGYKVVSLMVFHMQGSMYADISYSMFQGEFGVDVTDESIEIPEIAGLHMWEIGWNSTCISACIDGYCKKQWCNLNIGRQPAKMRVGVVSSSVGVQGSMEFEIITLAVEHGTLMTTSPKPPTTTSPPVTAPPPPTTPTPPIEPPSTTPTQQLFCPPCPDCPTWAPQGNQTPPINGGGNTPTPTSTSTSRPTAAAAQPCDATASTSSSSCPTLSLGAVAGILGFILGGVSAGGVCYLFYSKHIRDLNRFATKRDGAIPKNDLLLQLPTAYSDLEEPLKEFRKAASPKGKGVHKK